MEKTKILKNILVLLKAAKESPDEFKKLIKDDMPHPADSPEDKAHDVVEEDESLKEALQLLDTSEKRSKMLEHLRTLADDENLRSPENQEAGQEEQMEKQQKGVHLADTPHGSGISSAGAQARQVNIPKAQQTARITHRQKLSELKQMPKPNLPKSEEDMEKQSNPLFAKEKDVKKEETKHDRCVEEVSKDPKIKNPHAVCVATGVEPEKWKKGDKDMNKSEKSALELAKELLKAAKEAPEQFQELSKALAPATAPMPKPSMPKPKMAAPKPPKMHAPGMMKEEKEESKEDESKEHEEKESKEHEQKEKEMEKADKKMEKCGPMKMSKEEIKADLKKEWKPKFKKESK